MKKGVWKTVLILLLLLIGGCNQPSPLIGESNSGKWIASYQEGKKDTWHGKLQWQGEGKATILYREFTINGKQITIFEYKDEIGDKVTLSDRDNEITFVDFGKKPNISDTLEIKLQWVENEQIYNESFFIKR